ncbi:MAG TPA: DUF6187 family protein [Pseudonocardiaceae bacterium]|nr:DUF6187 family protein [Pseudonocardiaceae bacterium]
MSEHERVDTRFAMPAVDHPALTEVGVILSGLDIDRLLAGLGSTDESDDPTTVALVIDRLRHEDSAAMAKAVAAGACRWRSIRPALAAVDPGPSVSASIRQAWQRALRTVLATRETDAPEMTPAVQAYLAACWLRHTEVDRMGARRASGAGGPGAKRPISSSH